MKYLRGLLVLALGLFIIISNYNNRTEAALEMIPVASPSSCICFEYYHNDQSEADRTIYQTCEIGILDYVEDPNLELFTIELACDSVFSGTRIVDRLWIEQQVAAVDKD